MHTQQCVRHSHLQQSSCTVCAMECYPDSRVPNTRQAGWCAFLVHSYNPVGWRRPMHAPELYSKAASSRGSSIPPSSLHDHACIRGGSRAGIAHTRTHSHRVHLPETRTPTLHLVPCPETHAPGSPQPQPQLPGGVCAEQTGCHTWAAGRCPTTQVAAVSRSRGRRGGRATGITHAQVHTLLPMGRTRLASVRTLPPHARPGV